MNIYAICPGETEWDCEGNLVDLVYHVVAPTRGRAKHLFIEYTNGFNAGYDYTSPMTIRLLQLEVEMAEGVDEAFAWARVHLPGFEVWGDDLEPGQSL